MAHDRKEIFISELNKAILKTLSYNINDPVLKEGIFTIGKIYASSDLKNFKVYFSVSNCNGDCYEIDSEEILRKMQKAEGVFKNQFYNQCKKSISKITFYLDKESSKADEVIEIIKKLNLNKENN